MIENLQESEALHLVRSTNQARERRKGLEKGRNPLLRLPCYTPPPLYQLIVRKTTVRTLFGHGRRTTIGYFSLANTILLNILKARRGNTMLLSRCQMMMSLIGESG